ncbi:MAG TPA: hypothetical protein V6D30_23200 [Leptolyngbyaceae cyanobacterium]
MQKISLRPRVPASPRPRVPASPRPRVSLNQLLMTTPGSWGSKKNSFSSLARNWGETSATLD